MGLVAMKCPECRGDIEIDDSKEFGFCMYCGTKIMIERSHNIKVDRSEDVQRWVRMAEDALKSNFYDEAYKNAVKVTDADSDILRAWEIRLQTCTSGGEVRFCRNQIKRLNGNNGLRNLRDIPGDVSFIFPSEVKRRDYGLKIDGKDQLFKKSPLEYTIRLIAGDHSLEFRIMSIMSSKRWAANLFLEGGDTVRIVPSDNGYEFLIENEGCDSNL